VGGGRRRKGREERKQVNRERERKIEGNKKKREQR
jgi:hypothetical protein